MADKEVEKKIDDVDAEKDDKKEESNPADADFDIKDKADLIKVISSLRDRVDKLEEASKEPKPKDSDSDSDKDDDYSDLDDLLK